MLEHFLILYDLPCRTLFANKFNNNKPILNENNAKLDLKNRFSDVINDINDGRIW